MGNGGMSSIGANLRPRHSYVAEFIQVPFGQGLDSLALSLSIANTLFIHSANTTGALLWSTASRPGAGLFFYISIQ
jgi:hypothetical protein